MFCCYLLGLCLVGCLRYCFVVFVLLVVLRGLCLVLDVVCFWLGLFDLVFGGLLFGVLLVGLLVFVVLWFDYVVCGC